MLTSMRSATERATDPRPPNGTGDAGALRLDKSRGTSAADAAVEDGGEVGSRLPFARDIRYRRHRPDQGIRSSDERVHDIGEGRVHFRVSMDKPTPCGLEFDGPRQTLTTGSSPLTVDCSACLQVLEIALAAGGRPW